MTWGNPPPFKADTPKKGKLITPEMLAGETEHSQQVALFAWSALNVGKYPPLAYMFAIPNGGLRDVKTAVALKAEGVRAGVTDVALLYPVHCINHPNKFHAYHGCLIEMKLEKYRNRKNGGCSDEQIDFIEWQRSAGYYTKVCYNWMEARDTLISYLEGKL